MRSDLGAAGFPLDPEWYWRIAESASSLNAEAAARDFITPLARIAAGRFAITAVAIDDDIRGLRLRVDDLLVEIRLARDTSDRVAINRLVADLNAAFAALKLGRSFAIVAPRRFELRGVLLTDSELAELLGDPVVVIPSARPSWRH